MGYESRQRNLVRTWETTVQPTVEPVTLAELKNRLRILTCDFDNELTDILKMARKQVEADSYRRLITQTVVGYLDCWLPAREIELRLAPISAVSSIAYIDDNGDSQTFASSRYHTDFKSTPPRIILKTNEDWEETEENTPNAITITCTAGYGSTAATVPVEARLAIVEYARSVWSGCEGSTALYQRLLSAVQWTAYHRINV